MKYTFKTENTCSKEIEFEIEGNVIKNVKFLGGGCPGNLQALPKLVERNDSRRNRKKNRWNYLWL